MGRGNVYHTLIQCEFKGAVSYGENRFSGEGGVCRVLYKIEELDSIGKKPDVLIFKKEEYDDSWDYDISNFDNDKLDEIVPRSVCGPEIRSSAFLHEVYRKNALERRSLLHGEILVKKEQLLKEHSEFLKTKLDSKTKEPEIYKMIQSIEEDYLPFELTSRRTNWKRTDAEKEASSLLNTIKVNLRELRKRDLSITPKVEDLKVIIIGSNDIMFSLLIKFF